MQKIITWLFILAVILQLTLNVGAQVLPDPTATATQPPASSSASKPSTTTTTRPPSSSAPPPASSTTVSTLAPSSSSSVIVPSSSSIVPSSSSSVALPSSSSQLPSTSTSSSVASSTAATSSSSTPSASASPKPSEESSTNNTPLIVGCVVGGVVGIALIGGILACVNRRGGCTKRRDNNKSDFEDYGLGDFPHHRTTAMAAPVIANNTKPVSPTIPRLNDQGNYYADDGYGGHYGGGYVDNSMDYGVQQQHGGYYYPQQQQQEYYDDGNYYYDNNTSATAYSSVPPMQQHSPAMHNNVIPGGQQGYAMSNVPPTPTQHDIYKPDDVGSPINNTNVGNVPHNR
ncbi:hypothetical protein MAM1_0175c07277 [Mucor ambiguus]|uniref:Mid2 domain-containing protein n=1 Tax=Mucor ambiguus TaxID=91626 RepID=A0A0C9MZS3_9FUNG|nr:hypothetical protein MAM1_0175c07277 [Mucor ambiguus]